MTVAEREDGGRERGERERQRSTAVGSGFPAAVWLALLAAGKAADSLSTYVALSFGPSTLVEANPLSLALQETLGLVPALCLTFAAAVGGIALSTEAVLVTARGLAGRVGVTLPVRGVRRATYATAGLLYAAIGVRNTLLFLSA